MRKRKPGRLRDIATAALAVFVRQGFRLTQMVDVAREAGISAGALYSYVDSKEALLELAIVQALGEVPDHDQPFQASGLERAGTTLAAKLAASVRWPALEKGLKQKRIAPNVFAAVVDGLFTFATERRHLIWLLDRCAAEVLELSGLYQTAVRGRYISDFTRIVAAATAGRDLSREEVAARARAIFEMVIWMGMHRHRDRLPPPVSEAVARRVAVEIAVLAIEGRGGSRRSDIRRARR